MAQEFTRCKSCGIIFLNKDGSQVKCPKCLDTAVPDDTNNEQEADKNYLRLLKNALRDAQAKGEMLNTTALAELTEVPEPKIWHFINNGEIDTAALNDPKVREFMKRKRIERAREAAKTMRESGSKDAGEEEKKVSKGFHLKTTDDKKR